MYGLAMCDRKEFGSDPVFKVPLPPPAMNTNDTDDMDVDEFTEETELDSELSMQNDENSPCQQIQAPRASNDDDDNDSNCLSSNSSDDEDHGSDSSREDSPFTRLLQELLDIKYIQNFGILDMIPANLVLNRWREDCLTSATGSMTLYIVDNSLFTPSSSKMKIINPDILRIIEQKDPTRDWLMKKSLPRKKVRQMVDKKNVTRVCELVSANAHRPPLFDSVQLHVHLFMNDEIFDQITKCISEIAYRNLREITINLNVYETVNTKSFFSTDSLSKVSELCISFVSEICSPNPTKYENMISNCWLITENLTKNTPKLANLSLNWLVPYCKKFTDFIPKNINIASTPSNLSLSFFGGIQEMCQLCMSSLRNNSVKSMSIAIATPSTVDCLSYVEQLLQVQHKSMEFVDIWLRFEVVSIRNIHKELQIPAMDNVTILQIFNDVVDIQLGEMKQLKDIRLRLANKKRGAWRMNTVANMHIGEQLNRKLYPVLENISFYETFAKPTPAKTDAG